jgi:hypothetical protein
MLEPRRRRSSVAGVADPGLSHFAEQRGQRPRLQIQRYEFDERG